MKLLSWLRVSNLVLFMVLVSVGISLGIGHNEDAFSVLCDVLSHAERVLNKTGTNSGPLKEALYGKPGRVLTVQDGTVSLKGNCNSQTNRGQLCTYYNGGSYGCFAESLAGSLLCTCAPGNGGKDFCGLGILHLKSNWFGANLEGRKDLFQKVWDNLRKECSYGDESSSTHTAQLDAFKGALDRVRDMLRQGPPIARRMSFYLGEVNCAGPYGSKSCVTYLGQSKKHVHIPWLSKMQTTIEILRKQKHATEALPTLPSPSGTPPVPITNTRAELTDVESSETSTPTKTAEEKKTKETLTPGTPSPAEHPENPKGRSKRSTTAQGPVATSSSTEDTSITDEPEILDPTAAPFTLVEGADILPPLGLFMAASSFF
ncbi:Variant surface glycoprotein [Trypanosoma congolense IL3000]|uniref:Variant surface glycoprotein n=1 Tax=Trypanosoma congolense (strain IL3000) TaxID=1068625 RepID=F9W888_TRYCI|nr:Variant surface glycoprotein [Trypanosoma congolense IL3000]